MDKKGFLAGMDKLSAGLLCLFALECTLGCSGRWLSFGPVSIRMVLFVCCFFATLPNVLVSLRKWGKNACVIAAMLLAGYLLAAAWIGYASGNRSDFIWQDTTSFLTLALLPGFLVTVSSGKRQEMLLHSVYYGALVLAVLTVGLHFFLAFVPREVRVEINVYLNKHSLGGLAMLSTGLQRVYVRSQIFLQVALLLGLRKIWRAEPAARWVWYLAEAVLLYACFMTYTRGFWLGLAVSAVVLAALEPRFLKDYITTVGITVVPVAVLFLLSTAAYRAPLAAYEMVNRFDPNLITGLADVSLSEDPFPENGDLSLDYSHPEDGTYPCPDAGEAPCVDPEEYALANANAVMLRQRTLRGHLLKIGERPVFGSGLGTNLTGIRYEGKSEYLYLDMLMKLGTVGFLLFAAAVFLPVLQILCSRRKQQRGGCPTDWNSPRMRESVLAAAYVGLAVTSWFNPYLLSPMGLLVTLILAAEAAVEK